jgi:hypothetical protein
MENKNIIERAERTHWFMDARFGMFIHWGLYAIPARGEWVRSQEETWYGSALAIKYTTILKDSTTTVTDTTTVTTESTPKWSVGGGTVPSGGEPAKKKGLLGIGFLFL